MAGVKAERSSAGHKTAPKRPKDWVAPVKLIRCGGNPAVTSVVTGTIPAPVPTTDDGRKAVTEYDAACKALSMCRPNDSSNEGRRSVAYQQLVRLGLRPQVRGRRRGI